MAKPARVLSRCNSAVLSVVLGLAAAACGDNRAGPPADAPPVVPDAFVPLVVDVAIDPPAPNVPVGLTLQLTATATFSDGTTEDVTAEATWSSDDTVHATVDDSGEVSGLVLGNAGITATFGMRSTTTQLSIVNATIQSLSITPTAPSTALGVDPHFAATGVFSDGVTRTLTTQVAWSSSDPTRATISNANGSEGFSDTLAAGTTTITAAFGAISESTTLTIT